MSCSSYRITMEKLSIKLNDLSPLINTLIEKIQLLDSNISTKQEKLALCNDMFEVVDNMRIFFAKATESKNDEHMKTFVEKIERVFSQFEWNSNVAVSPLEFNKFSENGKLLISSILKLLGTKGCGILIIETYVKLCLKTICEMKENIQNKNLSIAKTNFKLLLDSVSSTANILKKYWHISFAQGQKNSIMLCLHQICKVLPYLLKMIEIQNIHVKKYLLNLLTKCLTRIQDEIHNDKNLKSNNCGQEFITNMNFCLYKLNELANCANDFVSFIEKANNIVAVLKPCIDELLYSVMTVAQVTKFKEDHSIILAASQKVLREFSELYNEIKEENVCAIRLTANSVGEHLCSLEQKVNVAVLKQVLEVFSNVNSPLKDILNKCRTDIEKDSKASEDLNVLVSDFDLEMDKIMQIGFFAISCTTSLNRILEIQSCLASLESLESELIPSLTALYMDCNASNKTNFQCLLDFWLNEVTELKVLIDLILDPAGFCGVVKNQIKSLSLTFKEDLSSSNFSLNKFKSNLKQAIRYSKKLIRTLKINMKDETESNKAIEDYLKRFQLAVQECEAVLNLLDQSQDTNKVINQAVKRYDFLMHTLEKLSSHLFLLANNDMSKCDEKESSSDHSNFQKLQIPQKNYYICESVDVTTPCRTEIPEILTPYVNKGILLSKKRKILYLDSARRDEGKDQSAKTIPETTYWDRTPVSSKRSRCCKPLNLNLELGNTIDLEITTILENISRLGNTFSRNSEAYAKVLTKGETERLQKNFKDVACGEEKSVDDEKPVFANTGCCARLDIDYYSESKKGENSEGERKLLGFELRNRFLQVLNDLSHNDSLLVANDDEVPSCVDLPDRINDLKIVDEKIKFLKDRMPLEMPQV